MRVKRTVYVNNNNNNNNELIPVIIGATGTISKSLRQNLSNISGEHEIKELQKTAILDTAHTHTHTHTSVSTNVKVQNIFDGRNNITYSTDAEQLLHCIP